MSNLLQTGAEFEKKLKERAECTATMLNGERKKNGKNVRTGRTTNTAEKKKA
ncbi:hypothetical protein HmCmsJML016_01041 [Escherichia coli]|nr:hypothetical protein HmCmsJML016_01041 [Escherichia coli]